VGLLYAEEALVAARNELDKVSLAGASPARILGHQGTVTLAVDNQAGYPLELEVQLSGDGLSLLGASDFVIELQPGRNELPVDIETTGNPYLLEFRLMAGSSVVDEDDLSVRPITVMTFLPWVLAAVVVIAAVVFAIVWLRRLRNRA
jgi:hypothetical protein